MNRRLLSLLAILVLMAPLFRGSLTAASDPATSSPAWASGTLQALKKVSDQIGAQHEPVYLNNLDCGLVDYRLVGGSTMQTGCFSDTAYGMFDSDQARIIFSGTDEALPLLPYSPSQILVPWPGALNLLSLGIVNTGGATLSIYRNPLTVVQDNRNALGQLVAKQLTTAPDLIVRDAAGQPLVINPRTITFSDNGSWLVAETLTGSFVRINLTTLNQVAFAPSFGAQGSPGLLNSRVAISGDGQFVAISNYDAGVFKVYDLANCPAGGGNCPNRDYRPFVAGQITGLKSIQHIRFINRGLLSFEVLTLSNTNAGIYELAPAASISSLIDYLGLGDSYTSGEGAFDYLSGSDLANNMCHLSSKSYPLLLTRDLFSSLGGRSVACSGAVIRDIGSTSDGYRGQIRDGPSFKELSESQPALLSSVMTNFVPGYVAQQRFAGQYQPRIITVSVGGDDIGFGAILQKCVVPHLSIHISDSNCYNTYEDRLELTRLINRTVPKWTALYKQLLKSAPGSRIYAIGYPSIVVDTGSCAINTHLGKSELEFSQEIVSYMNVAINKAAMAAGVNYADISQALVGHRLCETASYNVAVNGLTAGKDGGVLGVKLFGNESYHPNALGHELIEQAILKQTHNLTTNSVPGASGASKLLDAPRSGRPINVTTPDGHLAPRVAKKGQSITVTTVGSASGLKPSTSHSVRLDGPEGQVLGTAVSDANGDISGTVALPAAVSPGGHTIDVTGVNQVGEPVDVSQPIYVPDSDNDSDGDGLDDNADSCPGAANSGVDADQDGIDDTCDALIGQPPSAPPGATPISGPASSPPRAPPNTLLAVVDSPDNPAEHSSALSIPVLNSINVATVSGPSSGQSTTAKVLGAATYAPQNGISLHRLTSPRVAETRTGHEIRPLKGLPSIDWPHWVLLRALLWLLILLTATLCFRSAVQYAHGLA